MLAAPPPRLGHLRRRVRTRCAPDAPGLGGDVYVTWDGGALHLREVAGDPEEIEGPGDWVTLRPDMVHALMLFCEARRIP